MSKDKPMPAGRPPGFRFSAADGIAILVTAGATAFLWNTLGPMVLLLPIVLGHFFLFCNVFRIHRTLELIWAAIFAINVSLWWMTGSLNWWGILLAQTPVTILCIALEMTSSRYHGVGYAWINRQPTRHT